MALTYDVETCSRCHGSGEYSWNAINGTTCFRCGGKGQTLTKKAAISAALVRELRKSLIEKHAADLKVGDVVRRIAWYEGEQEVPTSTVSAVEVTTEPGGWNLKGEVTGYMVDVGFDGGPLRRYNGCQIFSLPLTPAGQEQIRALARTLPGVEVRI